MKSLNLHCKLEIKNHEPLKMIHAFDKITHSVHPFLVKKETKQKTHNDNCINERKIIRKKNR